MINKTFMTVVLALVALIVYLFVSAPPPLAEDKPAGVALPIDKALSIMEAENDIVRGLWTKEIVGAGKKAGLKFDEDWREKEVDAGPLPALFLRETATSLEKNPIQLSLYLGSDFPISPENRFEGIQMEKFKVIRETLEPQFFYAEDIQRYTAMFSDIALVEPCVTCHNDHEQSPKSDWKLNDVMGATTWSYPKGEVTLDELFEMLAALRKGFQDAYSAYLEKTRSFANPPPVGEKWPAEGYFLPSAERFLEKAIATASPATLAAIIAALKQQQEKSSEESQTAALSPLQHETLFAQQKF